MTAVATRPAPVEVGQTWTVPGWPGLTRTVTAVRGGLVDTTRDRTTVFHLRRLYRPTESEAT